MGILLDKKVFENLFKEQYDTLCKAVYKIIPDEAVAEDIVQEVFCWLWNNRSTLIIQGTLKYYLYQACINRSVSYLRKEKNAVNRAKLFTEEISGEKNSIDEYITLKETTKRVNQVIDSLPLACRTVFMLSRFEYKSYKEIGSELNISVKTVENHMVKALKYLRKNLLLLLPLIFMKIL